MNELAFHTPDSRLGGPMLGVSREYCREVFNRGSQKVDDDRNPPERTNACKMVLYPSIE